jgi:shikimate dehydrogenase
LIDRILSVYAGLDVALGSPDASGHDLVVNATSLGMQAGDSWPLDFDKLETSQIVAEVIMQPRETPLLIAAQTKGCRLHFGAPMLACQIALMAQFMRTGSISRT